MGWVLLSCAKRSLKSRDRINRQLQLRVKGDISKNIFIGWVKTWKISFNETVFPVCLYGRKLLEEGLE